MGLTLEQKDAINEHLKKTTSCSGMMVYGSGDQVEIKPCFTDIKETLWVYFVATLAGYATELSAWQERGVAWSSVNIRDFDTPPWSTEG